MKNTYQELQVYKKAYDIAEITEVLANSFDIDMKNISAQLLSLSKLLPEKIAAAESGNFYTLRVEAAFSVRYAAKELQSLLLLCKALQLSHPDYIEFLYDGLESFRVLFLNWVASFDKRCDYKDDWSFEI